MNTITGITRKTATVLSLVILSWASACKGPQGDVGPAGAQGAAGAQGPAGSANVIYSGWVNMNNASFWSKSGNTWTASFACPQATPAFLEKGTALVYCKKSDGQVRLLPIVYDATPLAFMTLQSYFKSDARIYLEQAWSSTSNPVLYSSFNSVGLHEFRYVLIPGVVPGRQAAVDFSDYAAVKKAYNLPD